MKLNIENTAAIEKPFTVFDADGVEVKFCVACETETGYVETLLHDGESFITQLDGKGLERFRGRRPAPLAIKWLWRS